MTKNRRFSLLGLAAVLMVSQPSWSAEGGGLSLPADHAGLSRWQSRVTLGGQIPVWHDADPGDTAAPVESVSIVGHYYFHRSAGGEAMTGGFRATSAVIVGSRTALWAQTPGGSANGGMFSVGRRLFGASGSVATTEAASDSAALAYLGLGYSGIATRSGWGLSADLGLVALSPGQAVKLGRVVGGAQNLEDVVRDMRLAPVVQLGVSYTF